MATINKKFIELGKIGSKLVNEAGISDKKIPVYNLSSNEYLLETATGVTQSDYVVSNEDELDAALADISSSGIGGSIAMKKGTYDKGSAFSIPSVDNIRLFSEGGAVIKKPTDLNAIDLLNTGFSANLKIENIRFDGDGRGAGDFLNIPSANSYFTLIKNCYFYMGSSGLNGAFNLWTIKDCIFEGMERCFYCVGYLDTLMIDGNRFLYAGGETTKYGYFNTSGLGFQGPISIINNSFKWNSTDSKLFEFILPAGSLWPVIIQNNYLHNQVALSGHFCHFTNTGKLKGTLSNNNLYNMVEAELTNTLTIPAKWYVDNNREFPTAGV